MEDFNKYNLTGTDIRAAIKYGRGIKAFKRNQLRAQATRDCEKALNMSQKQFASIDRDTRIEMVHTKTREYVNKYKMNNLVRDFNNK